MYVCNYSCMGYKKKNVQIDIYFEFLYVRWLVVKVESKNWNLSCKNGFKPKYRNIYQKWLLYIDCFKKRYIFKKKLVFWLIRWVKMILGVIGRVRWKGCVWAW